jgi:hypothetical protein
VTGQVPAGVPVDGMTGSVLAFAEALGTIVDVLRLTGHY